MNKTTAIRLHNKINLLINSANLTEAFSLLKKFSKNFQNIELNKIPTLEDSYKYMLHYMALGYSDPNRELMLTNLKNNLRRYNDILLLENSLPESPDLYSSSKRYELLKKTSLFSRLEDYKNALSQYELSIGTETHREKLIEKESALSYLFLYIMTMFGSSSADYQILREALVDDSLPLEFKSLAISALTLGNLFYFEPQALSLLLDVYDLTDDIKLSTAAIVGFVLIALKHHSRIDSEKSLMDRLSVMKDNPKFGSRVKESLIGIIRAHDTKRISSKMQNEVLPELMKIRPDIINKLRNMSEDSDKELFDINPEWEDLIEKSGVGEKLKELTEMQIEGGDVMMVAFSNLKNFPFFNSLSNWFIPFTTEISDLTDSIDSPQLPALLKVEGVMCDSDKYSFMLSLKNMPASQRDMMLHNMEMQLNEMKEALGDSVKNPNDKSPTVEIKLYLQNLYRFFKLHRKHSDFPDPFFKPLSLGDIEFLEPFISDNDLLPAIAEFYFKHGYYEEALPFFEFISRSGDADPKLWEKIGYCYNALKQLDKAILWYKKAELLNPSSQWLIKKLALCLRLMGNFVEACEYYDRALANDPENFNLLMSAGQSYLENDDFQKALSYFYHADYLAPDNKKTKSAIAWTELMAGNTEKALSRYNEILGSGNFENADVLNQGHALLVAKDFSNAIQSYKKYIKIIGDRGIARLKEDFGNDSVYLSKLGLFSEILNMILDKIKYDLAD